jgi:hypothetical protein
VVAEMEEAKATSLGELRLMVNNTAYVSAKYFNGNKISVT